MAQNLVMRQLDERTTEQEVSLLLWSPKMDILAAGKILWSHKMIILASRCFSQNEHASCRRDLSLKI